MRLLQLPATFRFLKALLFQKSLGTRHRAAVGISEVTDSLTVVVSEETGGISVAKNGDLHRDLSEEALKNMLEAEFKKNSRETSSNRWYWRAKKNG